MPYVNVPLEVSVNGQVIEAEAEVFVETPKTTMDSLAGTAAQYNGTDDFRVRDNGNGGYRIHVRQDQVRHRDEYVAMDIPKEDVLKAILAS